VSSGVRNFPKVVLGTLERITRSIKGMRGKSDGFVGTNTSGVAEVTQLGTGTASNTTYLRGDNVWAAPAGTATSGDVVGDTAPVTVQNIAAYNNVDGKHITPLTGVQGDVLYYNGTYWDKLTAGTSGQLLKTNGAGANPSWTTSGGGTVIGDDLSTATGNLVAYADGSGLHITEMTGAQGQVLYHNGTNWIQLAVGTNGRFLRTNGAAANPSWAETIPGFVCVESGTDLQAIVNAMTDGGTVYLGKGTFYGDSGTPSTPLTIPSTAYGIRILGRSEDESIIASPILIETGKTGLENLRVGPSGTDYGVKIYNGASSIALCWMKGVTIGAVDLATAVAGNAPKDGLILDGAEVFLAERCTFNFNRRHGVLVDSTAADPNVSARFVNCIFYQNGRHAAETIGSGAYLKAVSGRVEFDGGHSEGNDYRELYAEYTNNLVLRGFGLDTSEVMDHQVETNQCTLVTVDGCYFLTAASKATRAFIAIGCYGVDFSNNRIAGYGHVGVARFDWGCNRVHAHGTYIDGTTGNGWLEHQSR
jgi:hypothetical protein